MLRLKKEAEMPNAFPVLKPSGQINLQDVRSKFPLPGTYHFRFKMRWGSEPLQVAWMDVNNEATFMGLSSPFAINHNEILTNYT